MNAADGRMFPLDEAWAVQGVGLDGIVPFLARAGLVHLRNLADQSQSSSYFVVYGAVDSLSVRDLFFFLSCVHRWWFSQDFQLHRFAVFGFNSRKQTFWRAVIMMLRAPFDLSLKCFETDTRDFRKWSALLFPLLVVSGHKKLHPVPRIDYF